MSPSSFSNNVVSVQEQLSPGRRHKSESGIYGVFTMSAGYFPSVCLVCGGERGLHTLAGVMYGVPRRLTPIIEARRGAPLAAHYRTVVTLRSPPMCEA